MDTVWLAITNLANSNSGFDYAYVCYSSSIFKIYIASYIRGGNILKLKMEKIAPLFLFFSAFLWSLGDIFTKSVAWNGICLATLRGLIAIVVSGLMLLNHKIKLSFTKVLAGICYFAQGVLFMSANKYTTSANATVLQNTSPFYIILFNALIYKKKPSKSECVTCVCLLVGVSLAFVGNLDGGGTKGNTMALASSIFYAGVFFLSKDKSANPLESLFIGNLCYLIFVPAMLTNQAVRGTTSSEWVFLLVFATLTGIAAWLCFAAGIKHTSALQASFITISEPVMAPIWTFVFLHETITPLAIVGCVIVIATLLTYNLKAARTCS